MIHHEFAPKPDPKNAGQCLKCPFPPGHPIHAGTQLSLVYKGEATIAIVHGHAVVTIGEVTYRGRLA